MSETSVFVPALFKGRSVFITGGSSGINLGIAHAFAAAGANVAINGRNEEKLAGAVKELSSAQPAVQVKGFAADVRDYAAIEKAVASAAAAFGGIDVLVCGAAGNFPAPAVGMSSNAFKSVVDIDLLGTFNASRAAFEHIKKPGGSVINITAPQGAIPFALQAHVCAAKAGVDMLTRTLAIEWGGAGVRVNGISPGPIEGTEGMRRLAPDPAGRAKLARSIPMGRFGNREEIARLALFLASEAASYITGAIIPCDGGQTLIGSGSMMAVLTGE